MFSREKNNKSGQMLIESIVAINLILIGLLGIISLLVKSSRTNRDLGTSLAATYLAAEGVEIIKNIIDTDVADRNAQWNRWVKTGETYKVDYKMTGDQLSANKDDLDAFLNLDPGGRYYSYDLGGTTTVFKRKVVITSVKGDARYDDFIDPDDTSRTPQVVRVESFVSIGAAVCDISTTEKQEGCVRIQDEFYNWRKGTTK